MDFICDIILMQRTYERGGFMLKYYISYGSNMNIKQMKFRCPNMKVYGNGIIKGYKLVFNLHADIIQTNNDNDYVPVVVWTINNEADIKNLDYYEGYPSYYIKKNIDVIMDNGKQITGLVYVMADDKKGVYPPNSDYFRGILEGYKENGINDDNLYLGLAESIDYYEKKCK